MNVFKYIKLTVREFIGLESDYETLIGNQEIVQQSLEKVQQSLNKLEAMGVENNRRIYPIT